MFFSSNTINKWHVFENTNRNAQPADNTKKFSQDEGIEDNSQRSVAAEGISDKKLELYRKLQIFEQSMNHGFQSVFFIIKLTSYFQISYLGVMIITGIADYNMLNVMFGIPQILLLIQRIRSFLAEMTVMNNKSAALLEEWKAKPYAGGGSNNCAFDANRKLYEQKFVASCRPLQFNAGVLYGIKGNTLLTFGSGVLSNTAGVLIALKDKKLM